MNIAIALRRGATLTAACQDAGVALKTVCEWIARGRGEDPQRRCTARYAAFAENVARAQARAARERYIRGPTWSHKG